MRRFNADIQLLCIADGGIIWKLEVNEQFRGSVQLPCTYDSYNKNVIKRKYKTSFLLFICIILCIHV